MSTTHSKGMECVLSDRCSRAGTEHCNPLCYPYTYMHGEKGDGGLWATGNIPVKYKESRMDNLPDIKPERSLDLIKRYAQKMTKVVDEGTGLFIHSLPTKENPLGVGTGKTTSACAIMNEFIIKRGLEHIVKGRELYINPAFFINIADLQVVYNNQFRGPRDEQDKASSRFYRYKERIRESDLVVMDDIAVRNGTEAFLTEMYELIEHRASRDKATIFTSNVTLDNLVDVYGDRIVSRIKGMTAGCPIRDEDRRGRRTV